MRLNTRSVFSPEIQETNVVEQIQIFERFRASLNAESSSGTQCCPRFGVYLEFMIEFDARSSRKSEYIREDALFSWNRAAYIADLHTKS